MKQKKSIYRTRKNYDGTAPTGKFLTALLPSVLYKIDGSYQERSDLILDAWPQIVGKRLAPMTKAVKFVKGVLFVKVSNSTLLSLLTCHEKAKLLNALQEMFPSVTVRDIEFRIS